MADFVELVIGVIVEVWWERICVGMDRAARLRRIRLQRRSYLAGNLEAHSLSDVGIVNSSHAGVRDRLRDGIYGVWCGRA